MLRAMLPHLSLLTSFSSFLVVLSRVLQAITVLAGASVSGVMFGFTFGWKEIALPSGFDASAIAALVLADQVFQP